MNNKILIVSANYYNEISGSHIKPKDFRRNIVTEGVNLNNLVNKEFFIGTVKVKAHDLCRPCKHLTEMLNQDNILKEFLRKGGLRCQILLSSNINCGDKIKILD